LLLCHNKHVIFSRVAIALVGSCYFSATRKLLHESAKKQKVLIALQKLSTLCSFKEAEVQSSGEMFTAKHRKIQKCF